METGKASRSRLIPAVGFPVNNPDPMQPPPLRRCWVEVDLAALERNLGNIRAALPARIQYVAVVKADAYGHGIHPVVTRLMQSGAGSFAVANIEEARRIREIGSGWPILVLSAILPEEDRSIVDYHLIPAVSSGQEVERFESLARTRNQKMPVHLKIDTGMGRLGVWYTEAAGLYRRLSRSPHLELQGVYTHFSSADSDPVFTAEQRRRFLRTLHALPGFDPAGKLIHADNSAGLESFQPDSPFNAVRVGLLQFGILPYPDSLLSRVLVEPVLSFHTRVGLVKSIPAGTGVSYGRTHFTSRRTRVAVLTAGYGDGIPVAISNRGSVLIRGLSCPILGRVTMDQTIVDASRLDSVRVGDTATFIGRQNEAEIRAADFAKQADTIPYEVFTSVTKRVTRIYKSSRDL